MASLRGCDNNKIGRKAAAAALMALLAPGQALLAQSGPQGAVVTSGVATVAQSGNVTNVNQATERASINWQSFSVKAGEAVNFNQPGASSVTLNRVVGGERSVIEGALRADGQVFLLNSNGVLIAKGATVNAGGFVAGALDLADADFAAGRYVFKGKGGAVVNEGAVEAREGGYVAFLGGSVSNRGVVTATKGTVAMASGDKIRLDFGGGGSLLGVAVDEGALDALVENRGAVVADGGRVYLTAKAASDLVTAQVNMTGSVQARTVGDLKGRIELYADGGEANVSGTLDASAPGGGDGGFVETSGDRVAVADGAVIDTHAARGADGEWLIDPDGFTIGATANDGDVSAATLNANLANGNVTIASTQGSGGDGDINVNGAVSWSKNTLTLNATNNVYVNNVMTATGTAGLTANYGTGYNADETPKGLYTALGDGNARIDFTGTGALKLGGETYTVINTASQLAAARSNPAGRYALGSNINLSGTWTTALDNGGTSGFTGKFNGLGHQISGFKSTATSLFGTIGSGAAVSNLNVGTATIKANSSSGKTSLGVVADINRGSIVNVIIPSSTWDITDTSNRSTTITAAGVLVGTNYGLIAQSNVGSSFIQGVTNTTGGLVGVNESTGVIVDSWAGGGIRNENGSTTGYVGGLVGLNNGMVKRSYASNYIMLTGGNYQLRVGGFVGKNAGTVVESFKPSSNISSTALYFGGFVGENSGLIENAYTAMFNGVVNSTWDAGFAYSNSGTIRNAYTTISYENSDSSRYGFARENTGRLENAYWTMQGSEGYAEPNHTAGAIRLSGENGKNAASYNFASISDIWGLSQSGWLILRNIPVVFLSGINNYYGDAISYTATGFQGGGGTWQEADSINRANPFTRIDTSSFVDAGTWDADDIYTSSAYANLKGTIKIKPRPLTISGVVSNKVYDGTTTAVLKSGVAQNGLVGLVGGQSLGITYTSAVFQDKNVGYAKTVDLTYTAADGSNGGKPSNYALPTTTTATITRKPVDLTIAGDDRVYDGTTIATIHGQILGMVTGDKVSIAWESALFDDKDVGNRTITADGIYLTGEDAGNYSLSGAVLRTAAANIKPLPLQLYGLADEGGPLTVGASALSVTNAVEGDALTLGGSVGIAANTAGTQPIADFSSLTVDNPNYTVVGSVGSVIVGGASLILDRVTEGNAVVAVSGKTTTVTQTTDRAVMDWLRFSLGGDETLVFDQPSGTSIVLNRVITDLPSVIEGALKANGRVFILNAAGVLFTASSHVTVGALVASTFGMTDEDFMRNNLVFTVARGNGAVVSEGDIVIADNGFLALAGNNGVGQTGEVAGGTDVLLAAADRLELELDGLSLTGYSIGGLTGLTTFGGSVRVGSASRGGRLLTAGDRVTAKGFTLDTGVGGGWTWEQNGNITIGLGSFAGSFVNDNLKSRSLSLTSRKGNVTVGNAIGWSANTTLTLGAAQDINIDKSIEATGSHAGLVLNYGGDYHLVTPATFSGAELDARGLPVAKKVPDGTEFSSVTLSGRNAKLNINGDAYTLIHGMEDFAALGDATGTAAGYFALAGDLDAAAWSKANIGAPSVVAELSGTLAGLGHTVGNLTLNAPAEYVGLVGKTLATSETPNVLRDIGLTDVYMAGRGNMGALAGNALNTLISQAYSTGKIEASYGNVGGLVGYAGGSIDSSFSTVDVSGNKDRLGGLVGNGDPNGITITRSHATGDITGPKYALGYYVIRETGEQLPAYDEYGRLLDPPLEDYYTTPSAASGVGGLLGEAYYANIDSSYASGKIISINGSSIGGLVGRIMGAWGTNAKPFQNAVTKSFATGDIIGGINVGGLVGSIGDLLVSSTAAPVVVDNTYATGNVIATAGGGIGSNIGSIGGLIGSSTYSEIRNSYATGNVISIAENATNNMGGLVGRQRDGSVSGSYATGTVVGNGGWNTGGLVGQQSGEINDSSYQNANLARVVESAPVRAETGGIAEDVLSRESESKGRGDVTHRPQSDSRTGDGLDGYISYSGYDNYSARVKAISVEGGCEEDDEYCE
jgi:filamentous hemagglutinin family protein